MLSKDFPTLFCRMNTLNISQKNYLMKCLPVFTYIQHDMFSNALFYVSFQGISSRTTKMLANQLTQPARALESANPATNVENDPKPNETGLRRFLHGITYQLKLSLIVFAHAYDLMKKDPGFTCKISTEDPDAGKFDDIVYEYCYNGVANIICIQAKHKQKEFTIFKKDFIYDSSKEKHKNPPYALLPYFKSFLEMKQNKQNQTNELKNSPIKEYVLTTNAKIDENLKPILKPEKRTTNTDDMSPFENVFATTTDEPQSCYKFNWEVLKSNTGHADLIDNLKECSQCYTLAKSVVKIWLSKDGLRTNEKDTTKAFIVHNILGKLRNENNDIYEIADSFLQPSTPAGMKFRAIFEEEYKKQSKTNDAKTSENIWDKLTKNGIKIAKPIMKAKEKLPQTPLPDDEISDKDLEEFFEQFILACNTLNEEALDAKVIEKWETNIVNDMSLLSSATASENAYATLTQYVLDWMKQQKGKTLKEKDIETLYKQIIHKIQFIQLQGVTEKRLKEFKKAIIEIKPERLEKWSMYSKLSSEGCTSPIRYHSQYDTALIALMVYQSLKLLHAKACEHDYIFLDGENYLKVRPALEGIFKYLDQNITLVVERTPEDAIKDLTDLSEALLKLVPERPNEEDTPMPDAPSEENPNTELKKGEEEKKCDEMKKQQVVIIEQISSAERETDKDKVFFIHDVTDDSRKELGDELKDALYFGTNVQLEEIIEDDDHLQYLYDIIKEQLLLDE